MIEIVQSELYIDTELDPGNSYWVCWLELSDGQDVWWFPAGAPGTLASGELQAYFDAQETRLWRLAQAQKLQADVFEHIPLKRLLKAFALVVLDEINILRTNANLQARSDDQIISAIKSKLA